LSPLHAKTPWVRASKKDQSFTFFVPEGSQGATMMMDLVEMMAGLMTTIAETEPRGKKVVEFAFAIDQSQEKIDILRKALRKNERFP
jgi:predicted metal-dependent RNase